MFAAKVPEDRKEILAEPFQFSLSHPVHGEHLFRSLGHPGRHVRQAAIGKDHVGRHPQRLGRFPPFLTKPFEELPGKGRLFRVRVRRLTGHGLIQRVPAHMDRVARTEHVPAFPGEAEGSEFGVPFQQAPPGETFGQRSPSARGVFRADAVGGQFVVAVFENPLRLRSAQHGDHVARSEPLARPHHAGKELLGGNGHVQGRAVRFRAVVAHIAVCFRRLFTEVAQQGNSAAGFRFGEAHHGVQLGGGGPAKKGIFQALDVPPPPGRIGVGKEQYAFSGQAVAPRPADLLVIAFQVLGKIVVDHVPNVGLVDAHAEGHRGHHDPDVVPHEEFLGPAALGVVQAGVVGRRRDAPVLEGPAQEIPAPARVAVDDAGFSWEAPDHPEHLPQRIHLVVHLQEKVFPVEPGHHFGGGRHPEALQDVPTHAGGGRGGQGETDGVGEGVPEFREPPVFGPKVRAPFGNAVGFVDGEEFHLAGSQEIHHRRMAGRLRRHVNDPGPAGADRRHVGPVLFFRKGAAKHDGGNAQGEELVHLVLHERDEGRDHHGEAVPQEGRDLVADGFSAARGHDGQGLPAFQHVFQDPLLQEDKIVVAEDGFQDAAGFAQHVGSFRMWEFPAFYHNGAWAGKRRSFTFCHRACLKGGPWGQGITRPLCAWEQARS